VRLIVRTEEYDLSDEATKRTPFGPHTFAVQHRDSFPRRRRLNAAGSAVDAGTAVPLSLR
jgi:hypothetical protein